jgi:hypothetical protein
MFFHALKSSHDFKNPVCEIEVLPENNEQTRVLTFQKQKKYLAVASVTLKDVASLMIETGMRLKRCAESGETISTWTRKISTST